jgi:hypothetical protein
LAEGRHRLVGLPAADRGDVDAEQLGQVLHQRTPVRRPLPVAANTRRLRQCPRRTPAVRTAPPPGRGSGSTADTAAVSGSADTRSAVGTTTNGGQQPQEFRHRQSGRVRRQRTSGLQQCPR